MGLALAGGGGGGEEEDLGWPVLDTLSGVWLCGALVCRGTPSIVRSGTVDRRSPTVWLLGFRSGTRLGAIVGGGLGVHTVCDYSNI